MLFPPMWSLVLLVIAGLLACSQNSNEVDDSANKPDSTLYTEDAQQGDAALALGDANIVCAPCPTGFQSRADGCGCDDIDECQLDLCDGICSNRPGSFDCFSDLDQDNVQDDADNCPSVPNGDQLDLDADNVGDACDADIDGDWIENSREIELGTDPALVDSDHDGVPDFNELQCAELDNIIFCPTPAPDTLDTGVVDAMNPDVDADGILDGADNCFSIANENQEDGDGDDIGDACDSDRDGDRVIDYLDCDDSDPERGAQTFDQDCDGAPEIRKLSRNFSAGWQTTCGIKASGHLACYGRVNTNLDSLQVPLSKAGSEYTDWVEVSAGSAMACGIHSNGRMECFGERAVEPPLDERGQPYADWQTVDVGGDSTPIACAIRGSGKLYCFGQHRAFPPLTGALREESVWTSVALGVRHGCARRNDGTVLCFGENQFGQGTPPTEHQGRWIEMDAGYVHTCGRLNTGQMVCFGVNDDEQLDVPLSTSGEPIIDWLSVSVGGFAGCGLARGQGILCWGSNYYGQTLVPTVEQPWIALSSGRYHGCGQLADGTLRCWGWNSRGERDIPPEVEFKRPEDLDNCPNLFNPEQVDADGDGIGDPCDDDRDGDGLRNEQEPEWGLNPDSRDTDGDGVDDGTEFGCRPDCPSEPVNTNPATLIDALNNDSDADGILDSEDNCRIIVNPDQRDLDDDGQGDLCDPDIDGDGIMTTLDCDDFNIELGLIARDIDCDGFENRPIRREDLVKSGESLTCLFNSSGVLECYGQNHYDQTIVPTAIDGSPIYDWITMDIAFSHGCGIRLNGEVHCWGANYDGRGTPPSISETQAGTEWVELATGFAHTCLLADSGEVMCSGANFDGQCDIPLDPITESPYLFKSISAGAFHNCGITLRNELVCFGRSGPHRPSLTESTNLYRSVSAGRELTCAIRDTGEMECWAQGNSFSVPRDADGTGIGNWQFVTAGRSHACGIRDSGETLCFGSNSDDQLDISEELSSAISISAGGYHTCAVDQNFRLHCVGRNDHGQVERPNGRPIQQSSLLDNCPDEANPLQLDSDQDGVGDACSVP